MKFDKILKSNAIFTGIEEEPFAGSVGISGKNITYVGREDIFQDQIDGDTEVFDLGDRLVMPGFSDAHTHYLFSATILSDYCCKEIEASKSEEECVEMVKDFYTRNSSLDRLIGFGWFPINWTEGEKPHALPTKASLDAVFPDIPVYLIMADGHTFWLNSKALEQCHITRDTTCTFGNMGRFEDGEPNGILSELELLAPCFTEIYNFPEALSEKMQDNLLKEIAQYGITSFTDMAAATVISKDAVELKKIKSMEEKGKLTVRMNVYPCLSITPDMSVQTKLRQGYASEMIHIPGLKQFFDGVTSTYTAALLEPYSDKPDTNVDLNYPREIYDECILAANKEGFGVHIHAIGDYAVQASLDIFQHSKAVNPHYSQCRNGIEHIESIHPHDIPRFRQLNVTASVQPIHLLLDANEKIERIGAERCRYEWPFRTFLDMGVNMAFGTDAPVSSLNPYENLHSAITRKDFDLQDTGTNPEECISLYDALRAYTYGSAYSHNKEDELGTLEIGKLADITVVGCNLFAIEPEKIKDCETDMTIVGGKIVYQK